MKKCVVKEQSKYIKKQLGDYTVDPNYAGVFLQDIPIIFKVEFPQYELIEATDHQINLEENREIAAQLKIEAELNGNPVFLEDYKKEKL